MNKAVLVGRLTKDPDIRWTQGPDQKCVARYTLAVSRRFHAEGQQTADFISCVAFGKAAEMAEKYLRQGMLISVCGHIQTGSYENREGQRIWTTDVVIEEQEFAESKASAEARQNRAGQDGGQRGGRNNSGRQQERPKPCGDDGFMNIPDGIDEELPFA